ncbi:MAG: YkgJ family cysteine cluster protein [Desulfobacterales bacterium]|nr:YkgJ family cysteine cluster protein [Desulfobacterales bacterium]
MLLYPYDIIRLKNHLGMTSDEFLVTHTITAFRYNPNFPSVMLKMSDKNGNPCSFLSEKGCLVYENRPYSCRAYPLEPAIYGDGKNGFEISCSLVRHDHCLGHGKGENWSPAKWMNDQGMDVYNEHNSAWARVASMLHNQKTSSEKGSENPAMNMAFMASYNMDTFRRFVFESTFLKRFDIPSDRIDKAAEDEVALMHLGFDWILSFLDGQRLIKEHQKP